MSQLSLLSPKQPEPEEVPTLQDQDQIKPESVPPSVSVNIEILRAKKIILEKRMAVFPDQDYSAEWLELAEQFKAAESRLEAWCLFMYKKEVERFTPLPPEVPPGEDEEGGFFENWQEYTE